MFLGSVIRVVSQGIERALAGLIARDPAMLGANA